MLSLPRDMLLFVYGTLRRGEPNHRELGEARFLGRARTAPVYELVDLGSFPGLLEGGSTRGDVNAVVWLWIAFTAFMSVRGTLMWMRVRTDRWMVTGADLRAG